MTTTTTATTSSSSLVWEVHKFGGTSVANAECFHKVATIIDELLDRGDTTTTTNIAVVVSAMGGKPIKTTDLLLSSVQYAAQRQTDAVNDVLEQIYDKHYRCIQALFHVNARDAVETATTTFTTTTTTATTSATTSTIEQAQRLLQRIRTDLQDIRDILQTVSLMKWHSTRISELISGYGELWSTQILTLLLNMRVHSHHHHFVYLDARRVITVDETSGPGSSSNSNSSNSGSSSSGNSGNSHGSTSSVVCWDISQAKLQQVYQEEYSALIQQQQQQEEEPQRQGPIKLQSYYELRVRYEHSSINFNCVRSY